MLVDTLRNAPSLLAGLALLAAAVVVVIAPGRSRRAILALVPRLGRSGSALQRRILLVAAVTSASAGVALLIVRSSTVSVAVLVLLTVAAWSIHRTRPRIPRRPLRRAVDALRGSRARRSVVRLVRASVEAEVDPSIQASADLAWWAASITTGSVLVGGDRIATHTVSVPGRHGELTAVVPRSGAMTLLLVTSVGVVGGVSVRVAL